jgi:hypothetical protein
MADTPFSVPYSSNEVELGVADSTTLPAGTRGFIGVGYDGTNTRFFRVDANGHLYVLSSQLPVALVGGRLDTNVGAWLGSTTPTVGQKAMAASIPVAIASDQSAVTVSQGTPPWAVKGTDADGAAPTQNPVLAAGQDGINVQTLKTNTAGRLEQVLYDGADHPIGVIQDGTIYRLQVDARIARPSSSSLIIEFLKNGGSEDMVVDGDPTPVVFSFSADATDRIYLTAIRIVMSATSFGFDGSKFAKGSGLTNGLLLEAVIDDGIAVTMADIHINEDFARLTEFKTEFNGVVGDLVVASLLFSANEFLEAGSSDLVKITVRDDFTNVGLYGVSYLTATLYGYKEE